ncbi:MAG TPA: hypothetical protein VKS23_04965 [Thermoanaerobaculia bacterium]|nr:hypothetical protein [Thermoanaerobaculia bacterium]
MSETDRDPESVARAYARLSAKFKTLWTFHQFLQGVHRTSLRGATGPSVSFAPLYQQIKRIKETKGIEPAADTREAMERLDGQLDTLHATLVEDDRQISPSTMRQFFERVKAGDEELLLSILKFYYYTPTLTSDEMDKVDFLLTRLGTAAGKGGEVELKSASELQKLSEALLSLMVRPRADAAEVKSVVSLLDILRRDLEACERFEDLSKRKTLENIRTLKHRMGKAFYDSEVMQAVLSSNVAVKKKFQLLYKEEEKRILSASREVLEKEKDLEHDARFMSPEFREHLESFRKDKEEFEKASRRRGVRPRDVKRLKESLHRLLAHLDPAAAEEFDVGSDSTAGTGGRRKKEAVSKGATPLPIRRDTGSEIAWRAETDRVTSETARRLLASVDLVQSGPPAGVAAQGTRLETWEVRAALRILRKGKDGEPGAERDRLFFNAAVLRQKMDEEAQRLRDLVGEVGESSASETTLQPTARCLTRAREVDGLFRQALAAAESEGVESWNHLTRSRFRHLRAFAGLWLLYDALGGA